LPNGSNDPDFEPQTGPNIGYGAGISQLLVQPDGAIVAAGGFDAVAGLPINGLVRLLDPNVLHVRAGQTATQLQAWPVPAHEALQVSWTVGSPICRVQLLDKLGRVVHTVTNPAPGLRLSTAGLASGVYLLRVESVGSLPALRRIVIE
jgi:hypothetical protein